MTHKVYDLKTMPFKKKSPGEFYKKIAGVNEELIWWFFRKGTVVGPHHHAAEQITFIVSGKCRVTIDGENIILEKNQILHIPPNVEHRFEFLEDTVDVDTFSPPKM